MTNIWKKNIIENLKAGSLEYEIVREFLANLEKEFKKRDNKAIKVMELKRIK